MMLSLKFHTALVVLLWSSSLQGSVIRNTIVEHEIRDWEEQGFIKQSKVEGSLVLPVRVYLTQSNLDAGHDLFMDISDPTSSRFGAHLSQEQVIDYFKPKRDTIDSVGTWIEKTIKPGRIRLPHHKQWMGFDTSVSNLEQILHTKFYYYESSGTEGLEIGCDRYFIPHELQGYIDYITPGVVPLVAKSSNLMKRKSPQVLDKLYSLLDHQAREISSQQVNASCDSFPFFTPACIQQFYNITDTVPGGTKATIGIYNADTAIYRDSDLQLFFENYTSIPTTTTPTYVSIDGAPAPGTTLGYNYGIGVAEEPQLDVQMVYPLVYPAIVTEYGVDDHYYQVQEYNGKIVGFWNNFLDALDGSYCTYTTGNNATIDPVYPDTHNGSGTYTGKLQCGQYTPTDVITFSYILGETATPVNYQTRQCYEWMKLGMQGTSILFASGDHGVAEHYNPTGPTCLTGATKHVFGPNAPSNCPYVTSVGGTDGTGQTEVGWQGSGGGFSNIFATPSYQQAAVSNYLTNHPPSYQSYNMSNQLGPSNTTVGRYNSGGRGYPDVSALAVDLTFIYEGDARGGTGTSASAPIFAGIVTRINAARLAAGKARLGFLNQIFYNNPGMFNDITSGINPGCDSNGFKAATGWDPVTGLGTPNYPVMKQTLLALS